MNAAIRRARPPSGVTMVVLSLTVASAGAMRTVFSPVQEMAKLNLSLSDFQVSLVQGLAASIPVALLSIPIGRLADRANRVRLLLAMALAWTIGTMLTAAAGGFSMLFVARMLSGFGASCALPVAISIAADLSPPERRGRALLALSIGLSAGTAAAFALGGWLSGTLASGELTGLTLLSIAPWRGVHILFGLASGIAILPLLWVSEPVRQELGEAADTGVGSVLRELWQRRRFLAPLFIGEVSAIMADTAATIWASPVLIRDHSLQPAQFGGWMGIVILAPGIVGAFAGGYLADLGQKIGVRGGVLGGAVVASAVSIPAAFFPVIPSVEGFAAMLALLLFCGAVTGLGTATAVAVLVPNELRGVCLSSIFVLSSIIAFGIAPTLVTMLSGIFGGDAYLARALTLTGAIVSAVSLLAFVIAMARMPPGTGHPGTHR